jgi:thiamine biosynthesis lipoprotein
MSALPNTPQRHINYSRMALKRFPCMGSEFSLWIDKRAGTAAAAAFSSGQIFLQRVDRELTRFDPTSDLSLLNNDPRETVPVSSLTAKFVDTAIWAAHASEGLVDPTLIDSLEASGYRESLKNRRPASLAEAIAATRARAAASPDPRERWRDVSVDLERLTVTRPVGLRLDSGGSGKGMAADMLASIWRRLLPGGTPWIIDCGGDLRLGQLRVGAPSYAINVDGPTGGDGAESIELTGGAVATSGIGNRIWRNGDGSFSHHLIDPATGRSAWTGLVSVTAVADTTTIAETLSKTALLSGPAVAAELIADRGGVLVHDGGLIEQFPTRRAAQIAPAVSALELVA